MLSRSKEESQSPTLLIHIVSHFNIVQGLLKLVGQAIDLSFVSLGTTAPVEVEFL
ncbi:MAG: hypothetical protein KF752_11445 [Pirellulaceae bacterium]|nr:hypothetical protein [Pirellulaceae bacterium]